MLTTGPQPKDRSFLARYGATILRGGIAAIPSALYRYQRELGLPPQQVWFISAILAHKWESDLPHPSLHRMAEQTGVSRQQLHTYQRQLCETGWLVVINRRTSEGGKDTNFYDFSPLFGRLEELVERDQAQSRQPGREDNRDLPPLVNPSLPPLVNAPLPSQVNPGLPLIESLPEEPVKAESVTKNQVKPFEFEAHTRKNFSGSRRGNEPSPPASPRSRSSSGFARLGDVLQTTTSAAGQEAEPHGASSPAAYPIPQGGAREATARRRARPPEKPEKAPVLGGVGQSTTPTPTARILAPTAPQTRPRSDSTGVEHDLEQRAALTYAIEEISLKLGDSRHTRSNVTQARRILEASGLNQNAWTGMLWSVYHRTAEQKGRLKRPAAWFFRALAEELRERTNPGRSQSLLASFQQQAQHHTTPEAGESDTEPTPVFAPLPSGTEPAVLWQAVLAELSQTVTRPIFETYLVDTQGVAVREGRLVVSVPTEFAGDWLCTKLRPLTQQTLASITGLQAGIEFLVAEQKPLTTVVVKPLVAVQPADHRP